MPYKCRPLGFRAMHTVFRKCYVIVMGNESRIGPTYLYNSHRCALPQQNNQSQIAFPFALPFFPASASQIKLFKQLQRKTSGTTVRLGHIGIPTGGSANRCIQDDRTAESTTRPSRGLLCFYQQDRTPNCGLR